MLYASDYTTVHAVIEQLDKANPNGSAAITSEYDDFVAVIKDHIIPNVSAYISRYCGRSFVPYYQSKSYYFYDLYRNGRWQRDRFGVYQLMLDDDLLLTNSITWNGTLLSATDYREIDPRWMPYWAIEFNPDTSTIELDLSSYNNSVDIDGIWGFHTNLPQAYTTGETVTIANSTTTSITVADSDAYDVLGYLKCESELMQVTARHNATTIHVKRGVNGSTAAAHTAQALQYFHIVPEIVQAATQLATWSYLHRSNMGTSLTLQDGTALMTMVPAFVKETLDRLKRQTFGLGV